jgi:predicted enzyme related to lactoylglutathione lyase
MDYWLVYTGEGPYRWGLSKRMSPSATTINTVGVPSVDEYLAKIEKSGGKAVMPKTVIPGIGWFAYCQDTEGNVFGIMQEEVLRGDLRNHRFIY